MGYPYGGAGGQLSPRESGRPEPAPTGATAIGAAALSLGIGLICVVGTFSGAIAAFESREYLSGGIIRSLGLVAGGAILWSLGAILLFCRTTAGRVLVIIDCVLALIYVLAAVIRTEEPVLLTMAIPVLPILVLAAVKSTGRWIAVKPRRY